MKCVYPGCEGKVLPLKPTQIGYTNDHLPKELRVYLGCTKNPEHFGILCNKRPCSRCENLVYCIELNNYLLEID